MRKFKQKFKFVALFLSGLILLQSCSVYKTPVTLQQATQEEKSVKIITIDDDDYKYKYLVYEDGQFFGVKNNPGEDMKFPIAIEEVEEVLMKKGLPWWAWTLIIVGGILLIGAIICLAGGCGVDIGSAGWGY